MSEINGTDALLYRKSGANTFVIVGQMEITNAFTNTPIDISSKSTGDFIVSLDGESSTKGLTLSATLLYSDSSEYRLMRLNAQNGTTDEYRIDYTTLAADYVDFFGIPTGLSDAMPRGDKITTTITIMSNGEVT
tara:strand:- start:212 stop:613 length:402 start_codon:yes stop_codon:yes gene_type:complete